MIRATANGRAKRPPPMSYVRTIVPDDSSGRVVFFFPAHPRFGRCFVTNPSVRSAFEHRGYFPSLRRPPDQPAGPKRVAPTRPIGIARSQKRLITNFDCLLTRSCRPWPPPQPWQRIRMAGGKGRGTKPGQFPYEITMHRAAAHRSAWNSPVVRTATK